MIQCPDSLCLDEKVWTWYKARVEAKSKPRMRVCYGNHGAQGSQVFCLRLYFLSLGRGKSYSLEREKNPN